MPGHGRCWGRGRRERGQGESGEKERGLMGCFVWGGKGNKSHCVETSGKRGNSLLGDLGKYIPGAGNGGAIMFE